MVSTLGARNTCNGLTTTNSDTSERNYFSVNPRVAILIGLAFLPACSGGPPLEGGSAVQVSSEAALPAPSLYDQVPPVRDALIGPQDRISVEVWGVENISREVVVGADGRIQLPFAGTIVASGRDPDDLASEISQRLRQYIKDPVVAVNLVATPSRTFAIQGEVDEPGNYQVANNMTLMRAIAAAKGSSELANLEHVVIFREVEGQQMAALYNVRSVQRGIYPDPVIYPNDTIVVGESGRRRLLQYAVQLGPALITPLIYLLSNNGN